MGYLFKIIGGLGTEGFPDWRLIPEVSDEELESAYRKKLMSTYNENFGPAIVNQYSQLSTVHREIESQIFIYLRDLKLREALFTPAERRLYRHAFYRDNNKTKRILGNRYLARYSVKDTIEKILRCSPKIQFSSTWDDQSFRDFNLSTQNLTALGRFLNTYGSNTENHKLLLDHQREFILSLETYIKLKDCVVAKKAKQLELFT